MRRVEASPDVGKAGRDAAVARPADPLRAAFEASLRQAAKSPRTVGAADADAQAASVPVCMPPLPLQAAAAPQPARVGAVELPGAVARHMRALDTQAVPAAATEGRWHLRLLDHTLPVQGLQVWRSACGQLRVAVQGAIDRLPPAALERLALRLRLRGGNTRLVAAHEDNPEAGT